ncbi:MAG: restriction endonuclease [Halioglobus sp.]|nr:restriction endonuclease [Halioglobus sp.]
MAIPDYQTLMLPLLKLSADGLEHKKRDAVEVLSNQFELTEDERSELLPSGGSPVMNNRVGWASTYLKKAGLIESVKHGYFQITPDGQDLLATNPTSISNETLQSYKSFQDFKNTKKFIPEEHSPPLELDSHYTPEDALSAAYKQLRGSIEDEVLSIVKSNSSAFFERIVVDLLVKMGYGGNRQDAARAVGKSGDEGIDGIINEDKLGLDVIYIQAKRWENTVGRPEIQKFAGALQGKRAKKGIFITTSNYSKEALSYASSIDSRIILIDGARLSALLVDYNVGVTVSGCYEIKQIDSDYFDE